MNKYRIFESRGVFYIQEKEIRTHRHGLLWLKKRIKEVWVAWCAYDISDGYELALAPLTFGTLKEARDYFDHEINKKDQKLMLENTPDKIHSVYEPNNNI